MRQRLRELEGRLGAVESEKGELERENTLIKALLPPLSPAAQALMSLAAGGTPGISSACMYLPPPPSCYLLPKLVGCLP